MVVVSEGTVPFIHDGEEFQTYYKIHGSLANSTKSPIILIHGGPGFTHNYLTPLADLAQNEGQAVILYDQLGNGGSTRVKDKPSEWFTVKMYVDELANLIERLGIKEYHILGHSWGGPLATEFEVERQPAGLKSLIITNSVAEMALAGRSFGERIASLDDADKVGFATQWDDPKTFRASLTALHKRYAVKYVKEFPKDIRVLDPIFGDEETGEGGDPTVLRRMDTKTWGIIDRLHRVRVPTLLITGKDDMLQSYCSEPYFWNINKVKWIEFHQSSHVPFWEEREKYMEVVGKWLSDVESK